jgi:hypothetical protein
MIGKMNGTAMNWRIFKMKIQVPDLIMREALSLLIGWMMERFMILTYNIKTGIWCFCYER